MFYIITIPKKGLIWLMICCCLSAVTNCTQKTDEVTSESSVIQNYLNKICDGSNTCDIVHDVPKTYQTLAVRNCMCDSQCTEYGDCCQDSKFKNPPASKNKIFKCVKTLIDGNVYMITECPSGWNHSLAVLENCHLQDTNMLTIDVLSSTPVTSVETNRTYKNMFCALCNDELKFKFWNILVTYEGLEENGDEAHSDIIQVTTLSPSDEGSNYAEPSNFTLSPPVNADDILNSMDVNNDFYWEFTIGKEGARVLKEKCFLNSTVPKVISNFVRHCVPDVIDSCASTKTECASNNTSYLYIGNQTFKNKSCVKCNNVSLAKAQTCMPNLPKPNLSIYEAFTVSIVDKRIPKLPKRCTEIPSLLPVYSLFCQSQSQVPDTPSKPYKRTCFPMRKDLVPPKPCLVNRYFFINDSRITLLDNDTILLGDTIYRNEEEFWYSDNQVIVCGTYINSPKHVWFIMIVDDILTFILIKVSIVCLILQLLVFQQLPELKNLSGKNLACFSFTLMIAFICYDVGPLLRIWTGSCRFTAIILHYSLLSCFMWMLIMSYDCWLSLYRATAQFRTSGKKHALKFTIYCVICWTLPLISIGYSVYLEFSPAYDDVCALQPGYGLPDNCFFFNDKAIYYFFFIPASASFLGDICFFAHTAYMIYLSQRKSVNPNTRNDFRLYTRLALMMGLTWTLGSLTYITHSAFIGLVFTVMNMSQGIFIFFGFTFKKKFIKLLLDKHKNNRLLSTTLSTFVSGDPTKITSENKTETEAV